MSSTKEICMNLADWFRISDLCEKQGVEITPEIRKHFHSFPTKYLLYLTTDTVGNGVVLGYYQKDTLKNVKMFY